LRDKRIQRTFKQRKVWNLVPSSAKAEDEQKLRGRKRADRLLVERGIFESRAKAQAAIEAGLVSVNDLPVGKPSDLIPIDADLRATAAHPYVSRGGAKLAAALDHFTFDPRGRVCLDVGASTGGFTDVLLKRGAKRVYAVDVGHGQLHRSLRDRPEVISFEKTDIRAVLPAQIRETPNLVTVDVSFISLKLVLPVALKLVAHRTQLVALIKPQFEAGRDAVSKGIVRDEKVHAAVKDEIAAFVAALGWRVLDVIPSPISGRDGNAEFLLGAVRD
jgi:23S rRNA (cytidine1920-2'-O)/16S rRNA (cytidine1409-2'-O)-methyltransferase